MNARENNLVTLTTAGLAVEEALSIQAVARALHRLDTLACNAGQTARQLRQVLNWEATAQIVAHAHGWVLYRQRDPRGWPLYIGPATALGRSPLEAAYDRLTGVCPR